MQVVNEELLRVYQVEDTAQCLDDLYCFYLRRHRPINYLSCTGKPNIYLVNLLTCSFHIPC